MIIQKKKKFTCLYCQKQYDTEKQAKDCVEKHDLILLPVARTDLNKLMQFIFFKKDEFLSSDLIRIIQRYNNKSALKQMRHE